MEFKRLSLRRFPQVERKGERREEHFWRKFQFPIVVKEYAAVTSVHFSAAAPHDFVVTSGSKVQVYSGVTNQVKKTISRFKEVAYSGHFRHDGMLVVAGSEEGMVKVFDVNSRAILRQCKGHTKAVKAVRFSQDGLRLVSGSDDTTLRYWDMATETCICSLRGHKDYVRSVVVSPVSRDHILTGSYDHKVQLWDLRSQTAVLQFDHGAPVEAALMFPSGGTCISAGGSCVKVWDVLSGGRLLATFSSHQKTITALCFDGGCRRLLSGALDKQLKVYSIEDYGMVHSTSYPAPILSLAMSPTDSHLVVGMSNRLLSIKHRPHKMQGLALALPEKPRGGTYRYFVRGKKYKPSSDVFVVVRPKMKQLRPHDDFLRKFQYKNALDAALEGHHRKGGLVVYSLLQELARRDGLTIALSGRDEEQLRPLLFYLVRFITHPRYTPFLVDICEMVTDIYGEMALTSKKTRDLLSRIWQKVLRELKFQQNAFAILGMLDTLLTASTATERHSIAVSMATKRHSAAVSMATETPSVAAGSGASTDQRAEGEAAEERMDASGSSLIPPTPA